MISPDQHLLHLTSRAPKVRGRITTASYINETKQALTNINKFGLLHYSLPKSLDMVDELNGSFYIRFIFAGSTFTDVQVDLPLVDYYQTKVDTDQRGGEVNQPGETYLTEILQTSINWAIQEKGANTLIPVSGPSNVNRIGCVVKTNAQGRLEFYFGYRGNVHTITDATWRMAAPTSHCQTRKQASDT